MIQNDQEYHLVKQQAEAFERALENLARKSGASRDIAPALQVSERQSLEQMLAELRDQLAEYEELQAGRRIVVSLNSFDDLPRLLIQARIVGGMSRCDLAEKLDLSERQVQEFEETHYRLAPLSLVARVIQVLGIGFPDDIEVTVRASEAGLTELQERIRTGTALQPASPSS